MNFSNFIHGQEVAAKDGSTIDVVCPSDGKVFATIPRSGPQDVELAVTAARHAFDEGEWPRLSRTERGRVLMKISELVLRDRDHLSELEAKDVGKLHTSAFSDVTVLSRYFEYYAGAADKLGGELIPSPNGFTAYTEREPLGVVAGILPWNSPTQMFGRVVAPALAMGNTIILKPAEDACLTVSLLAKLSQEAGVPDGVINVVTGYGHEVGAALSSHPKLDFISFTGSQQTGTLIQQAAGTNQVGVTLELGGKSPHVVFADADMEKVLPTCTHSIIFNSGQTCTAGSRLLVEESVLDEVCEVFANHFNNLVAGAHDSDANLAALINEKQRDRVVDMVQSAIDDGVPLLAEGKISEEANPDGYFVTPKLFGPVPRDHFIAREEVFGPVLCILPFKDEADAIALANDTAYGLAAGVWTSDAGKAMRCSKAIRAGQIYINGYGAGGGVEFPFGGFKKSGHGREKGLEALLEFSATKTVIHNHG